MRRPRFIARQASRPDGLLGRIVARVMSCDTASVNDAALERLAPRPGERVLEVGFGPGRALRLVLDRIGDGHLAAIDHSPLMVRRARRRFSAAVDGGRLALTCADVARLPWPSRTFDAVYTVHTIYFWSDLTQPLEEMRRVAAPGGRLVVGFRDDAEARASFPEAIYTFRHGDSIAGALRATGWVDVAIDRPFEDDPGLGLATASRPG